MRREFAAQEAEEMIGYEPCAKAELHCHLGCLVDLDMLRQMAQSGIPLSMEIAALERAYPVNGSADFNRWVEITRPLRATPDDVKRIIALHMERLKRQSVVYTEIMLGPRKLAQGRTAAQEEMTALRAWVDDREEGEVQVEFLGLIHRNLLPEAAAQAAEGYVALFEAGLIVGIAVAGWEPGHPIQPLQNALAQLHEAGVPIEIHAGEWCGPESVWDALKHGFPSRIGHGVALFLDPALVRLFQERQIHIEMCPTANLRFGAIGISRIEDHPIGKAKELGLRFSVNTDCPGAAQCSMASEYALLHERFGFTERDFQRIVADALTARFQPILRGRAAKAMVGAV